MTHLSAEEIKKTIDAMNDFREEIRTNPQAAEEFVELMNERPKPHPLTPLQRNEKLRREVAELLSRQNGNGSTSK